MGRAWTGWNYGPPCPRPNASNPPHPRPGAPGPVPPTHRVSSPHPPSRRGRPSQMPPSTNRGHRPRLEQDVGLRLELVLPRSRLVEAVLQVDRAVAGRGLEEHADRPRCPPQMVRHGLVPHEHLAATTTTELSLPPPAQRGSAPRRALAPRIPLATPRRLSTLDSGSLSVHPRAPPPPLPPPPPALRQWRNSAASPHLDVVTTWKRSSGKTSHEARRRPAVRSIAWFQCCSFCSILASHCATWPQLSARGKIRTPVIGTVVENLRILLGRVGHFARAPGRKQEHTEPQTEASSPGTPWWGGGAQRAAGERPAHQGVG